MEKNLILLILQGIPASGKSTWAREFVKDNSEEWIIVNRDSIRDMLGNYWVPSREKLVTQIEQITIANAFGLGYNVIIDATNLNPKTIKEFESIVEHFIKDRGLSIDIAIKEFKITPEEAIERDKKRKEEGGRSVGTSVITGFYNKYYGKKE